MNKFEKLKNKKKFIKDSKYNYSGIKDPEILVFLNQNFNKIIDDFEQIFKTNKFNDKSFQDAIKSGLEIFSTVYLDTEDRERLCLYFEELMDIVNLESSGGHLNVFMYGFDPMT